MLRGKRWMQNRMNPYDQPPKGRLFSFVVYFAHKRRLKTTKIVVFLLSPRLRPWL